VSDSAARRPKIVDVAKAAGVSPTMVSHALNRRGQVDPRTRERDMAGRTGPEPLRAQVRAVAQPAGRLDHPEVLPSLDDLDIGGAVVVEPQQDDEVTQRLSDRGVPVVAIGEQPDAGHRVPFVDLHADYCSSLLLTHLHDTGARNIALVVATQRRESSLAALREYEVFARRLGMAEHLVLVDEREGEEGARRRMAQLLDRTPDIDGVCAMVDTFATGAVRAIRESGRALPGDVRVATRYDGIRARTCEPPLTRDRPAPVGDGSGGGHAPATGDVGRGHAAVGGRARAGAGPPGLVGRGHKAWTVTTTPDTRAKPRTR
jgi:DNA-binding LacI/PurR family transcriptional regulator